MRDSIGGSMLLYLVIIFAGLVITFFAGILSYSKAYKVKNRTIELLEKYGEFVSKDASYNESSASNGKYDVWDALSVDLKNIGYDTSDPTTRCNNVRDKLIDESDGKYNSNLSQNKNNYDYNLCIFEMCEERKSGTCVDSSGYYFVVVSFVRFEFPIIGDVFTFPVYGETRILGKNYNYD